MSPETSACKTPWCVALAAPDGAYCRLHGKRHDFRLIAGAPITGEGIDPECVECGGDGDCIECYGDGDCTCHCGDAHDCHHCHGSGKCPMCERTSPKRDKWAEEYVRWAFDAGWQPYDVDADYRTLR